MDTRQLAISSLTELIIKSDTKPIKNSIVDSTIFEFDPDKETYTCVKDDKVYDLVEFRKILADNPLNRNIFRVDCPQSGKVIFANLEDPNIAKLVTKSKLLLNRLVDRAVMVAFKSGFKELIFNERALAKTKSGDIVKVDQLRQFTDIKNKLIVMKEVYPNLKDDIEINTSIQGLEVRIVFWQDKMRNKSELIIELLEPISDMPGKVVKLFKESSGFMFFNRDYSRYLNDLLDDKSIYRRIAYIGMGSMISSEGYADHYSLEDVSIDSLRNRDYDVYVINTIKLKDIDELLNLPVGKLIILVIPADNNRKALSYLDIFKLSPVVKHHILGNIQSIVMDLKNPLLLDNWSRELLALNTLDLDIDDILVKLQTNFVIRDDIKNNDVIDIHEEIKLMFMEAQRVGASNIDIAPGSPVRFYTSKLNYRNYSGVRMDPVLIEIMVLNMLKPADVKRLYEIGQIDMSYGLQGVGRYRVSIMTQRSSLAVSIRPVPNDIPRPEQLNLPKDFVDEAVKTDKGITLIVGEPNSGKTVTFNCIMDEINREKGGVLFLMGNPIEYTHRHSRSLVLQAEVGYDLPSYSVGISKSLRTNTSTLGFEELRTREEFAALGSILNSPVSVFMTMHAPSVRIAVQSLIDRISESGISNEKARDDVSNALNFVLFQRLIEYKGKRVLIYEKLKVSNAIRALIRNGNFSQLDSAMGSDPNCETLDDVILKRLEQGMIDFDTVRNIINDKSRFRLKGFDV